MKVLISFDPDKKLDNFEGSRLRKCIKGALESSNIDYTSDLKDDDYDVVHLLSYDDLSLEINALEEGKTVVVSALMCESDSSASFLDFDFNDGKIKYTLSNKALKFLNNASTILVPSNGAKQILLSYGVKSQIRVCLPGVNLNRFNFQKEEEKELFYRYFREDKNKKIVIANGSYDSIEGIGAFINAAKACPNAVFYFFGQSKSSLSAKSQINKLEKMSPKNAHFKEVVPDDIYRSALINASVFMLPCYRYGGVISILEALAAKCEVVIRSQDLLNDIIIDGINGRVGQFSETLVELCKGCLSNTIKNTVTDGYNFVLKYSLNSVGEELKSIYEETLQYHFDLRRNKDD